MEWAVVALIIFAPFYAMTAIWMWWFSKKYNRYERVIMRSMKKTPQDVPDCVISAAADAAMRIITEARRR
jgi:hypothetical protein